MSAAELRQAAETLRARAGSMPLGKSETACAWDTGHALQREDGSWILWTPRTYAADEQADYAYGAAYFATMHPGVGRALADWLDHSFRQLGGLEPSDSHPGLVVARLVNGGQS